MSTPADVTPAAIRTEPRLDVQTFPSGQPYQRRERATDPDAILWLRLDGQLTSDNRQQLKLRILDELADGRRDVVLDFGSCGYVDSSGLGVLLSITKRIRDAEGQLVLVGLNDDLRALFTMTRMAPLFTFADDNLGAIALLARPSSPSPERSEKP